MFIFMVSSRKAADPKRIGILPSRSALAGR
jgi:hypothetical protein